MRGCLQPSIAIRCQMATMMMPRRWMGTLEKYRRRMERKEARRNADKKEVPWMKPREIKTFVEARLSKTMKSHLEKKTDPADKFENGWIIASSTVLVRANVVQTPQVEEVKAFQEMKFVSRDEKNTPLDERMFRKEGTLGERADMYFETGSNETEADRKKDVRSVWRKLDKRLYLVFKAKASAKHFQFPQRVTLATETMRGSAKKVLKLVASSSISCVHHSGFAPLAVFKRVFNEAQQKQTKAYGAKVFFFPAYLIDGNIQKLDQGYDFRWLTKEECAMHMAKDYYAAVKDMLF